MVSLDSHFLWYLVTSLVPFHKNHLVSQRFIFFVTVLLPHKLLGLLTSLSCWLHFLLEDNV